VTTPSTASRSGAPAGRSPASNSAITIAPSTAVPANAAAHSAISLRRVGLPIAIALNANHGQASHAPASMIASSGMLGRTT
jgi:hypothetical protein